jgi:hypothetical protein
MKKQGFERVRKLAPLNCFKRSLGHYSTGAESNPPTPRLRKDKKVSIKIDAFLEASIFIY